MQRALAFTLAAVFVISALTSGGALAEPKGAIQLGAGMATVSGAPMMGLSWDNITLHAAGIYFPAPWAALIADLSFGLEHEYEMRDDTDSEEISGKATYLDVMAGACKHFTDGGFIYASAGLAVGWTEIEVTYTGTGFEIDTGVGIALGAGVQIPIKNTFMGFASFRQRYIPTELKEDDMSVDMNAGGFELTAGVSWTFGG